MQEEWKKFIGSLPHEAVFLHRDEFNRQYPHQNHVPLPAVFVEDSSGVRLLISHNQINETHSVQELIKIVERFLSKQN